MSFTISNAKMCNQSYASKITCKIFLRFESLMLMNQLQEYFFKFHFINTQYSNTLKFERIQSFIFVKKGVQKVYTGLNIWWFKNMNIVFQGGGKFPKLAFDLFFYAFWQHTKTLEIQEWKIRSVGFESFQVESWWENFEMKISLNEKNNFWPLCLLL